MCVYEIGTTFSGIGYCTGVGAFRACTFEHIYIYDRMYVYTTRSERSEAERIAFTGLKRPKPDNIIEVK